MTIHKPPALLAAGAAPLSTAHAVAGPAGEGRTFTVDQMHKQIAARTVKVASANTGCLSAVASQLTAREDVSRAAVVSGAVHVTFRTADSAADGHAQVRDAVAKACA